ncbi:MAG: hypothetical protein HY903_18725 [Deltaproteobacteria bacterium]|nr:hypothetical protein [Deltaproteobacteria bacterium]
MKNAFIIRGITVSVAIGLGALGCGRRVPCQGDQCGSEPAGLRECGPGYTLVADECVEDRAPAGVDPNGPQPTPCDPNPCTEAHRGLCQASAATFVCRCEPGFHDDGQSCTRATGCDTVVTYRPASGESVGSLYIRGSFNNWDLSQPMPRQTDGSYRAALQLQAGEYGYKLYDQDADRWFEDPANPYVMFDGAFKNSRLRVRDCNEPLLLLANAPSTTSTSIAFDVRYVDGASLAGAEPTSLVVSRNDLPIAASLDAGTQQIAIRDSGLAAGKHTYRFQIRDRGGHTSERLYVPVWIEAKPWRWTDAVLYFAFTDRFADGDPTNNQQTPGVDFRANWQGGDFAGLTAKIESGYFDDLGVNALWLSSIVRNTAAAGQGTTDSRQYAAYHSYWPVATGWRQGHEIQGTTLVDPHFGTLEEFKALVGAAHRRGIRVLLDLVANHVHADSPLVSAHRNDGWFYDYFLCGYDERPVSCWFADYLPDLDHKNLAVMNAVVEHAAWLAMETDIDGYRLDAVKHMVHELPTALRARLQETVGTTGLPFYIVGETFVGEGDAAASLVKEYVNPKELDGQFDFPLYWQVVTTFLREERSYASLEGMLQHFEGFYGAQAVMANFLGNHDVARAASHAAGQIGDMYGNGAKAQGWDNPPAAVTWAEPHLRLRLAWTFLLTIPGVPLIYYGDELGMEGAGDPDNRKRMRFDNELHSEQQTTLAHVKKLTAARRAHPAFSTGKRRQLLLDGNGLVWAYGLATDTDQAVVVFNRSGGSVTRDIPVSALGLASGTTLRDVVHGTSVTVNGGTLSVTLGNRDAAVLVVE